MLSLELMQYMANTSNKNESVKFISESLATYRGDTVKYNTTSFSKVSNIKIEMKDGKILKENFTFFRKNINNIKSAIFEVEPINDNK